MEALVLGIDNSLIPVEIGTCNEIQNFVHFTVTDNQDVIL